MIKLDLEINEVNAILLALAKLPFETVAPLIEKIRAQGIPQIPAEDPNAQRDQLQADLVNAVNTAETVDPE
jgi:hypothetical protein